MADEKKKKYPWTKSEVRKKRKGLRGLFRRDLGAVGGVYAGPEMMDRNNGQEPDKPVYAAPEAPVSPMGNRTDDEPFECVYAGPEMMDRNGEEPVPAAIELPEVDITETRREPVRCVYAGPEYFARKNREAKRSPFQKVYAGPPVTERPEKPEKTGREREDFKEVYAGPEFFGEPEEPEEAAWEPEIEEDLNGIEDVYAGPEFFGAPEEPEEPEEVEEPEEPEEPEVPETPAKEDISMMEGVYAGPEFMPQDAAVYAGPEYFQPQAPSNPPESPFLMTYAGPQFYSQQPMSGFAGIFGIPVNNGQTETKPENFGSEFASEAEEDGVKKYFCSMCGIQVERTAKFCGNCGSVLKFKEEEKEDEK